jgi:hypothetical protein
MSAPPKAAVEGFNLAAAKELALSKLPTEPPASFRAAIKSPLADALLTALATYAGEHIARLRASKELDVLRADVESGARGGGINPLDPLMANDDSLDEAEAEARFRLAADLRAQLAARADAVRATEVECDAAMRSVGSAYAAVIVKHSNREKPTVGASRRARARAASVRPPRRLVLTRPPAPARCVASRRARTLPRVQSATSSSCSSRWRRRCCALRSTTATGCSSTTSSAASSGSAASERERRRAGVVGASERERERASEESEMSAGCCGGRRSTPPRPAAQPRGTSLDERGARAHSCAARLLAF